MAKSYSAECEHDRPPFASAEIDFGNDRFSTSLFMHHKDVMLPMGRGGAPRGGRRYSEGGYGEGGYGGGINPTTAAARTARADMRANGANAAGDEGSSAP